MLRKKFCDAPGTLDFPLEVEITDHRTMSASRVHRGCVLNLFSERYFIDLVSIPLRGSEVFIEIDWLGPNRTPIGKSLNPKWGRTSYSWWGSFTWASSLFSCEGQEIPSEGCSRFLAYVVDTRVEGASMLSEVPIVRDFLDVFLEDLPGVPPERQVELQIDLIRGAAPIAKAPYRLEPPEV